jgi:hypothetical protein
VDAIKGLIEIMDHGRNSLSEPMIELHPVSTGHRH